MTASKLKRCQRLASLATLVGFLSIADITWAHNLSQGYNLPASLWLYAFSVMATVIASVAMVGAFVRSACSLPLHGIIVSRPRIYLRGDLLDDWPKVHLLVPPLAIGGASVGVFMALLIVSSVGDQRPATKEFNTSAVEQVRPVRITMPPGITFERCLTLTPDQTLSYRFQAGQPLVFDIHYHTQNVRRYAIDEHPAHREKRTYTPSSTREYCLTWQNAASDPIALAWAFAITTSDDKALLIP